VTIPGLIGRVPLFLLLQPLGRLVHANVDAQAVGADYIGERMHARRIPMCAELEDGERLTCG
jgi:hypothetical protein